eukprot:scaffold3087_cov130-Alexandrium_tamarense.AAC.41
MKGFSPHYWNMWKAQPLVAYPTHTIVLWYIHASSFQQQTSTSIVIVVVQLAAVIFCPGILFYRRTRPSASSHHTR